VPTATEKLLSHRNKRSGVLVPLLEDLFTRPVEIENLKDAAWLHRLMQEQLHREEIRSLDKVFSPSSLANCLRQVHLAKNYDKLGIKRQIPVRVEPNFYFLTGNWLHMKWQYALYKLNQRISDEIFKLVGVEYRVASKHKDHAGTIDAIVAVHDKYYIVDIKGVNVRTFNDAVNGNASLQYKIQISDYAMLANVDRTLKLPKIEAGILLYENKGGPSNGHPIALHEVLVDPIEHLPEIKYRLESLRKHEKAHTIPAPECTSIRETQFLSCPFRNYCKEEVRQKSNSSDSAKRSIAVPKRRRTNRS
jgi:PD-(D/E)XK nuclease superfamily